jgi:hypothetical protein
MSGGRRVTKSANSDIVLGNDEELIQLVAVDAENIVEPVAANDEACRIEPKVDHARMWLTVDEHQFAEVSIVSDEHPLFGNCDSEHRTVFQVPRVIGANPGDIVALTAQVGNDTSIGAGIDQESHTCAG